MDIFEILKFINNLLGFVFGEIGGFVTGLLGKGAGTELVLMILAAIGIISYGAVTMMALTWFERKLVARIQDRIGPNMAGPFGLMLPLADGVKMLTKEDTTPANADRWVYLIAPLMISAFAMTSMAVVPFAPNVVGTNLDIGAFFYIAIGSGSTIAILMAGWGSNNKYSLLGAFRTVAQLVGYEVPMLLNVLPVVMLTGSMSLVDIINKQTNVGDGYGFPFILFLPLSALVFIISGIAETGRSPFDLMEAESEIVAGFHVEYSGMKFALFMMGEYVNAAVVAFMFSTFFLGGYAGPIFVPSYVWFLLKSAAVFSIFMWLRGTLPRVRVDQLVNLNWKFFVPLSIINIIMVMIVTKVFVTSPIQAAANGGILVPPVLLMAILFAFGGGLMLAALSLAARSVREKRQAEERVIAERRAVNRAFATAPAGK